MLALLWRAAARVARPTAHRSLALCAARAPPAPPAGASSCLFSLAPPGWRAVPREDASRAAEALLRAAVRSRFTCRDVAGHFTVELDAPFAGAPVIVLAPGYASGSALWAPVLDDLARTHKVYAVDWLGTGASARPAWRARTVAEGEAFFVGGLAAWAAAAGVGQFALAGHSLGGYLAAAFALAHPGRLNHLVLIGAAGMPGSRAPGARPDEALVIDWRARSYLVDAAARAWEAGVTPGGIVRSLGPWGEALTRRLVERRFGGAAGLPLPLPLLAQYMHAMLAGAGSGEHALSLIFYFGARAKSPMGPRLCAAAPGALPRVTIVYGEQDWMDVRGGGLLLAEGLRGRGVDAACVLVPRAGHFAFLDAPVAVARAVRR